ncbi:MAG TPA: hypothetical protein VLF60_04230 [Candidatus Saccharimonadales bacterium]|nr:hypothetical protein [Candidatus Saccharimonadales bacterium]
MNQDPSQQPDSEPSEDALEREKLQVNTDTLQSIRTELRNNPRTYHMVTKHFGPSDHLYFGDGFGAAKGKRPDFSISTQSDDTGVIGTVSTVEEIDEEGIVTEQNYHFVLEGDTVRIRKVVTTIDTNYPPKRRLESLWQVESIEPDLSLEGCRELNLTVNRWLHSDAEAWES